MTTSLMQTRDGKSQPGFLFIGELARETGVDPKTIRFYERAELLSPPRHGRFRTYLAADVMRLKNVLNLRRMGVPIADIRKLFAEVTPELDVLRDPGVIRLLQHHMQTLRKRSDEVAAQMAQTEAVLGSVAV